MAALHWADRVTVVVPVLLRRRGKGTTWQGNTGQQWQHCTGLYRVTMVVSILLRGEGKRPPGRVTLHSNGSTVNDVLGCMNRVTRVVPVLLRG